MGEKVEEVFEKVRSSKGEIGVRKLVNETAIDEKKAQQVKDNEKLEKVQRAASKILDEDFKVGEK